MSSLDGEVYASRKAALADIRRVGPSGLVAVSVDSGNDREWLIYSSRSAAYADRNGAANNAIARIETVSSQRDPRKGKSIMAVRRRRAAKSRKRPTRRSPARRPAKRRTAARKKSFSLRDFLGVSGGKHRSRKPAKRKPAKRKAAKKRSTRRDWPGQPRRHATAARKGWRAGHKAVKRKAASRRKSAVRRRGR